MEIYESISHWGMFPITPNLASHFKEGWEAALGLHLLEERS